jgi:hypothetical protein
MARRQDRSAVEVRSDTQNSGRDGQIPRKSLRRDDLDVSSVRSDLLDRHVCFIA